MGSARISELPENNVFSYKMKALAFRGRDAAASALAFTTIMEVQYHGTESSWLY